MAALEIRHTAPADLPRLLEIYEAARAFMVRTGNPHQWAEKGWPPADIIEEDIVAGRSYVCTADGRPVACFLYLYGQDVEPTYAHIEGAWISDEPYGVVHRIAADGSVPGAGTACLNWALAQHGHLRIDTHEDNLPMQNLLTKLGFKRCGIIYLEDGDPRIAYEKLI